MPEKGVVYYATGHNYVNQALRSAESLKQHTDIHVTVYSDQEIESKYIDEVVKIPTSDYPFYDRIKYFKRSPYKKTLYIDTDTIITDSINPVFKMLERFDIVARIDPFRNTAGEHWGSDEAKIDVPRAFPEYQCGVLGYKNNDNIITLLEDWRSRYSEVVESDLIDQPFLREALYRADVDIGTLPSEYNLLVNNLNHLQSKAVILHFNGGYSDEIALPVVGTETKHDVINKINSHYPSRRAVYPGRWGGTKILTEPANSTILNLYTTLNNRGFRSTCKRVLKKFAREIIK